MTLTVIIILILPGIIYTEAKTTHEDISISGCSESDGEYLQGLDGDEMFHSDFNRKKGVVTLPEFADPMSFPGIYELSVNDQVVCKQNLDVAAKAFHNPPEAEDPPQSTIYPRDEVRLGSVNTLICHVTGFFPPPVRMIWTKNDENVTEGVSLSQYYPNNDLTFNLFFTLRFTPAKGDIYSCTVQHQALPQPLTREWVVKVRGPSVGALVFCEVGLTLGLLGVAAGIFFFIKADNCN